MNEASGIPTFETIRGRSWIDLTLCNNILAQNTGRWTCGEEESCSDHKLILFDSEAGTSGCNAINHAGTRYKIKKKIAKTLRTNLCRTCSQVSIVLITLVT
jgi:hypothetical protein